MDQYIGRLLDNRYEILEVIGTGGMAVVYKARCHRLNRLVAIKILKDEFSGDDEFRRRFHAEGEAVAMLSHPNIVQVYDVSSSAYANYIVMELVDGISMKQYMEKKGVLNWKETLHFAMQIAKGLEHAHSRGIVHRDIKPHNVMVLKNGSVKVMDFGIARIMSKTNTLTKEALGSVHYISPEQAKGGRVDNRSDLYSLSVVMYEMTAGRPPYDGESPVAVAIQHINGGAAMPSTLNPNIPGGLEQIIMKGMSLDVNDRYASASEMLRDMEEFRKNPNILFSYQKSAVNDSTQPINLGALHQPGGSKSTAQRVARSQGDRSRQRSGSGNTGAAGRNPGKTNRSSGNASARQKKSPRELEAEEKRSRMTTIAIVACSAVAVIAIAVFLVALVNGAFFNREAELVEVPDLLGDVYYTGMNVDGFYIDAQHGYNSEYEKGRIYDQNPASGNKIIKGSTIKVMVSLGEAPVLRYMENLLGQSGEDAKAFLVGQGMNPLVLEGGFSDHIRKGVVMRTDPAEGELLADGQTIYIYVSQGPMIPTAEMPYVVGLNYATAYKQLTQVGFTTVEPKYVESEESKDEVVGQSIAQGTDVDLTVKIILYVSKGPKETAEPTTEPTTAPTTEPTTEPTTAPTTEPTTEPTTAPTTEPTTEPTTAPTTEPTTEPTTAPTTEPTTEPTTAPTTEPTTEPTTAPTTEPTTEPTTAPTTEPTTEPTTAPNTETTTEPASESEDAAVANESTKTVRVMLPQSQEAYLLTLKQNGKMVRETTKIMPGSSYFELELTGSGVQHYEVFINGQQYQTIEVDFS